MSDPTEPGGHDPSPRAPGQAPHTDETTPADAPPGAHTAIGPYQLQQKLGEGGMGEVWLAEQLQPIRRRVALKIIKRGMDTRHVIARFEAERQALALMDHPAIAKVLDAGETERGRPYFVMEYVKGVPIAEYCDTNGLSTRDRLDLFVRACDGVQHAHQKAIIHRDLKPSNVLVADVDGRPQPKIIDFGLAKAMAAPLTDRTMFTELGQLMGTPEYMSPEQADLTSADVDTRSDVYSLGVILYELLTGALPFDTKTLRAGGFDALRKTIREVDPPTPSTRISSAEVNVEDIATKRRVSAAELRREVRGDLDWIVMTALQKDRNRRYQTVNALAADVRRHLNDEPVMASPPSATYKLGKLIRRNRALFGAIGTVLAVLVVAVAVTSWGMVRARSAEQRAAHEARIARAVNDFLNNDLLAAVAPSAREGRGKDVSMREVLDVAARRIDEAAAPGGRLSDVPRVEGAIRTTLGNTYEELGDYAAAEPHLERALAIATAHGEGTELAHAQGNVGYLAYKQGRYEAAEASLRRALESWPGSADDPWPLHRRTQLANVIRALGRSQDAEDELRRALSDAEARGNEERAVDAMQSLAVLYQEMGENARAESLYVNAIEVRRRLYGDEDAETVGLMNNLANTFAGQGRLREAVPLWERALASKRRIYGEAHPTTLNTLNNLAEAQEILGSYGSADSLHTRVVAARAEALGDEHPDTVRSRARLAYVRMKLGRLAEADSLGSDAHDVLRRTLGADHSRTLEAADILGMILLAEGRNEEAASTLGQAYRAVVETQPDDAYTRSLVGAHLGLALASVGRREEAEARWTEALPGLWPEAESVSICEAIAGTYDAWHADDSTRGHDARAAEWRERASRMRGR